MTRPAVTVNQLKTSEPELKAEVVIRDKDGNVKYQGQILLKVTEKKD